MVFQEYVRYHKEIGKNMNNKIIVMPVYNRPDYTRQVIEGIKKCYNHENYTILIFAEPGCPKTIETIKDIDGLNIELSINENRLGMPMNTYQCFSKGFELSDYVIYLEDDVVPSKDALLLLEWVNTEYKNNESIFNATCYSKIPYNENDYYKVNRLKWFTSWGCSLWKDRWENLVVPIWKPNKLHDCWSQFFQEARGERDEIMPIVSRAQNIGLENGVHRVPKELFETCVHTPYHVEYIDYKFDEMKYSEKKEDE